MIELLVVLGIMTSLISLATPSLPTLSASITRNGVISEYQSQLVRAQNEALRRGGRAIIEFSSDGGHYSVGIDEYPYNQFAELDTVLTTRYLPAGFSIGARDTQSNQVAVILFDSRGQVIDLTGSETSLTLEVREASRTTRVGTLYSTGHLERG